MKPAKTVEEFFSKATLWKDELQVLRKILKAEKLDETVKWGIPVYTVNGKNVIGLGAFKAYVGLWFYQGALLKDEEKKLFNAQENKTKAQRQWRFASLKEIKKESSVIKKYVREAVENEKQGRAIKPQHNKPIIIPPELASLFSTNKKVKNHFDNLLKSKQREYAEYVSDAKREETKIKRLQKIKPLILQGRGLYDKYK